ncbi:aminopeptidase N, putative [Eimeria tenella]|nr:aminopeptidase N, putative [Eimeria tenella]CDJ37163.1 aminopeptidase N, putative [Eimeria tenella]|eukprot:XP_013228001.1 aminopeptidase N, putative [Eimeria tenella]
MFPNVQMAAAAAVDSPVEANREEHEDKEGGRQLPAAESGPKEAEVPFRTPHALRADFHRQQADEGPLKTPQPTSAEAPDTASTQETKDSSEGATHGLSPQRRGRPGEKFRDEYKPSDFTVESVDLNFLLDDANTKVFATIILKRAEGTVPTDLVLNGEDMELLSLKVNGKVVEELKENPKGGDEGAAKQGGKEGYRLGSDDVLIVTKEALPQDAGETFTLQTEVSIHPVTNLKLKGLYVSGTALVTQCEAEGFRRITYFLDRPDVMATYKVRLEANKAKYPILLSNGNKADEGPVEDAPHRHFAVFDDPHPKPSYLFAILAGNFEAIRDTFTTKSGKDVALAVYSEPAQLHKLNWAMHSVKVSMKWEEDNFGREYDLDAFNVACVSDFNAGAMENKGLNIFNCTLLLASMDTSTDEDFERVLAIIGHEYFHNWTGNRVTVRDWFQLTLKEGLTVFREQLFMGSVLSAGVQRIQEVADLISRQFAEDDGPMAHPIRPESYLAMDNFYTATVYDKGAEVVRIYHTLLGTPGFRKGMDLYFQRHDNQAATCDDFRAAMADSNGVNLDQMERWYTQAGTPRLEVLKAALNKETKVFEIRFKQYTPATPGQNKKLPQVIPIKMGLIGKTSRRELVQPAVVLEMTEEEQTFRLNNISEDCVPSILRGFSAPVILVNPHQTEEDMAFLMAYDSDPVTKWFASRALATPIILSRASQVVANKNVRIFEQISGAYIDALRTTLTDNTLDNALKALLLQLPDWSTLSTHMKTIDPEALHLAIRSVKADVAAALKTEMAKEYEHLTLPAGEEDDMEEESTGRRKLRNTLLFFLSESRDREAVDRAVKHFTDAKCMTDRYAGLITLGNIPTAERETAFARFYEDAAGDPLVLDKWFRAQARSDLPDQVERVAELLNHPAFSLKNPNRLRSLIFTFASLNPLHFHRSDGKGYELLANVILEVDRINPVAASRGAKLFLQWRRYNAHRQRLIESQLHRILSAKTLSKNVKEVVSMALDSPHSSP